MATDILMGTGTCMLHAPRALSGCESMALSGCEYHTHAPQGS